MYVVKSISSIVDPINAYLLVLLNSKSANNTNSTIGNPYPNQVAKGAINGLSASWVMLLSICKNLYTDVYNQSKAIRYKNISDKILRTGIESGIGFTEFAYSFTGFRLPLFHQISNMKIKILWCKYQSCLSAVCCRKPSYSGICTRSTIRIK